MEPVHESPTDPQESDSENEFNFKCRYCFKNLSSRQNLKEHTYIHTGEKPYVCSEEGCGKKFRQGSLLSIHRRIHQEVKNGIKKDSLRKKVKFLKLTELLQPEFNNFHVPAELETIKKVREELKGSYSFVGRFLGF